MSLYTKVNTDLNFVEREHEVEKFWEDRKIFEKSMKIREGSPTYTFSGGAGGGEASGPGRQGAD